MSSTSRTACNACHAPWKLGFDGSSPRGEGKLWRGLGGVAGGQGWAGAVAVRTAASPGDDDVEGELDGVADGDTAASCKQ